MKSIKDVNKLLPISSHSRLVLREEHKTLDKIELEEMKKLYVEKVREATEAEFSEVLKLTEESRWILSLYSYLSAGRSAVHLDFCIPKDRASHYSTCKVLDFISDPLLLADLNTFQTKLYDIEIARDERVRLINNSYYWGNLSDEIIELGIRLGIYDEDEEAYAKNPVVPPTIENLASIINSTFTF